MTSSRSPRRAIGRILMIGALAAAGATAVAPAAHAAGTVTLTIGKGGTNADGSCGSVTGEGEEQVWQFNLTGIKSGGANALLTASFSDGTSVSGQSPDRVNGGVAKWFVTTESGATLTSASADATNVTFNAANNPNLVVSHCTLGGETPPPPPV
jgi:hypothetical protein